VDLQAAGSPAKVITLACAIRKADSLIIVSPEYSNGLRNSPGDSLAGSFLPG
jgi:NAD(P)H-dependent FMN reductase